jgi:hypothetical protein
MMYAKEFINIPPKERDYWLGYQIGQPISEP